MKVCLCLAIGLLVLAPCFPASAADVDPLRPKVAKILERHGIIGNAAIERRMAEANERAASLSTADDSAGAGAVTLDPLAEPAAPVMEQSRVAGLIVQFVGSEAASRAADNRPPPQHQLESLLDASPLLLEFVRPMSLGRFVFHFPEPIPYSEYRELEAALIQLADVDTLSPDTLATPQLIPNDPSFYRQWNLLPTGEYSNSVGTQVVGIDAVRAWDLVGASSPITVAVVDTGITSPPPIERSRVLPGFDFITDPNDARDGNGWDDDPTDRGDYRGINECEDSDDERTSSWHGTRMLTLIAATGNDGYDIAGIDWNANILPVRVLGKCGGASSDIVDGMLWAAGYPVPGTPVNENPARIVNLSLGRIREQGCSSLYQDAMLALLVRDVVVVAAAGNDDMEAALHQPSNCLGAISVGSVDYLGERASYSNWSESGAVDISAPAGDRGRHGNPGGLLAVGDNGNAGPTGILVNHWTSGTSAAAALVSGSLSLAMSLDPLQHTDLLTAILFETAQPFGPESECEQEYPRCGVGIIDLEAMIQGALVFRNYAVVRDFYHAGIKHYFRSGNWDEVSLLVKGAFGDWKEGNDKFLAWRDGSTVGSHPVCRFYGTPGIGPNSHFYTVDQDECEFVKLNDPGWTYEGTAFYAKKVDSRGGCPRNTERLYRYYNQRAHVNDSNHRYTTSLGDREEMEANGWVMEGVAMCVPD